MQSLGKAAYEKCVHYNWSNYPWEELTESAQSEWEDLAQAIIYAQHCNDIEKEEMREKELEDEFGIEIPRGAIPPIFGIAANPHARHDMSWSTYGGGLCTKMVMRPNGTKKLCEEAQDHVIHGGPRYEELPFVDKN